MLNLSYWINRRPQPTLKEILQLSDDIVLGNISGRYKKDNTANTIYNLIKGCSDVDAVALVQERNKGLSIIVSSNSELYCMRCERKNISDHKSLNSYMHSFINQPVYIRQINSNSYTWLW